ncbi:MAG TPA: hypothetical protein VHA09_04950 [Nitrososphaera sp.]|nr:hypothetical protein [Nitrososphaera sp.]
METLNPSEFRVRAAALQEISTEAQSTAAKLRVEFTIPANVCGEVMDALEARKQQASIYESKACGWKKQKYTIDVHRGTGKMEITSSDQKTVVSIVDSDKAEGLVNLVRAVVGRNGSPVILSEVHNLMHL